MKTIVVVSGGFDPIHSGHIQLIKEARALGDQLIVGINSDEWLARKKGRAFMPWQERLCVINNLQQVDEVYTFDDDDGTACHLLQQVRAHYPADRIIFANGGDRTQDNIPEMSDLRSRICIWCWRNQTRPTQFVDLARVEST
jgi:cytidyltransferase-like protein